MKRPPQEESKQHRRMAALVVMLAPNFTITEGGLLLRLQQRRGNKHQKLAQDRKLLQPSYIPTTDTKLQEDISQSVHQQAGHPGSLRTYQILQRNFSWGNVYTRTFEYVGKCTQCQYFSYTKHPQHQCKGTLKQRSQLTN